MVERAKRILTKEKIDGQLSGQSSSTLFMSIRDNPSRRVTFDTGDKLGDKIDKLTVMIGKLASRDSGSVRQFKPQIYQGKRREKIEVAMLDAVMISEVIKINAGQIVETGDSTDKIEVDKGINKIIEEEILEVMQGCIKILKDKTVEESTEIIIEMKVMAVLEIETGLEKDHFLQTSTMIETKGCLTFKEEIDLEHLQQMLNLDDEQTSLKSVVTNTHEDLNKISSEEDLSTRTFKLTEGKNDPTIVFPLSTNIGGQVNFSKSKDNYYLTKEQARHVYKKVESGSIVNTDTLQQEIEHE